MHLWLGLFSGVIVFIIAVTGCIYVFQQEITGALRSQWINVKNEGQSLPFHQIWNNAQKAVGDEHKVLLGTQYTNPEKSCVFLAFEEEDNAWSYFGHVKYYYKIYVNPYTGKVLKVYDEKNDFFQIVKMIHWSLLLKDEIGQPIVGVATLIFVFLLISGVIMWWPKKRKAFKKKLALNWNHKTKWMKKNFDLHGILAIYSSLFAFIIAITGLVWAFQWVQMLVYVIFSMSVTPPDLAMVASTVPKDKIEVKTHPYDIALEESFKLHSDANGFQIAPPLVEDTTGSISVYVQQNEGVYYKSHGLQFDQYSGELLKVRNHNEKNFGEQVVTANYDIHVGAILGIPGKILAFVLSLMIASLPVTGFIFWYNRDFKHPKKRRRA
ncbi:MAG: hypothetical protein CL843_18710 [Crocinitomicaceae bacterium]|nr:hypothetical protein [Crocinitomicaceae bacterium]|tara:strand:+ start:8591 stop:9730 length:1140 start_codon:yes stop_codon:yes gene_type:complete